MSCFSTVSAVTANSELDLTKHVNYTAGMILGVDDFTQEFAYLAGRDRWLARDALGYGTISGLSIQIEEDAEKGARVMVQPGVAVSPRGQFICVPTPQCAYLNQWLAAADTKDLDKWIKRGSAGSPPVSPPEGDELTLYVVLCYRDCATDNVPIPGEPCRSEDDLTAASRVKDDFSLELRFESPKHAEEKAVRNYVEWLKQITVTGTGASTPLEDFIKAIRDEWLTPPSSPPVVSSPPAVLQINSDDFCEYMRVAFRLWVTELRNVLSERKTGCAVEMTGGKQIEDCVLLAELRIPLVLVSPNWKVSDTEEVEKIEKNRPFLLHLRMLQEWMLCGCHCTSEIPPITSPPITSPPDVTSPPITSPQIISPPIVTSPQIVSPPDVTSPPVITSPQLPPPPHDHTLDSLTDVTVPTPTDGQILIFRGSEWVAEDQTVVEPVPVALDDLTNVTVPTPTEGQILIFRGSEWIAENPAIVPPVPIALDNLTDVVVPSPTEGQMLVFRSNRWIAETRAPIDHGTLTGLGDDDHQQYLLTNGSRALTGNLLGGNRKIVNLAAATANGEAVIFQQAIKNGDSAGGDLTGTYPNPTINNLQGRPVQASSPNPGDRLAWNGTAWVPQPQVISQPEPPKQLILPLATITRIEMIIDPQTGKVRGVYEIWFNIDAPGNIAEVIELKREQLRIIAETPDPTTFHTDPYSYEIQQTGRNLYLITDLTLKEDSSDTRLLRFMFDTKAISVRVTNTSGTEDFKLDEYADNNKIKFNGLLEGRFATIFVRGFVESKRGIVDDKAVDKTIDKSALKTPGKTADKTVDKTNRGAK